MGSLLRMILAEQNLFKVTKSICICQGKKLLSLNQFPRKFHLKIFGGSLSRLARIFHELLSRDREDGRATWQPQGVGSEAYLKGTSQGPTPEDARKDGHIRGRSR